MSVSFRKTYSVILADPPWSYRGLTHHKMILGAKDHYNTMACSDIAALPVESLAGKDCFLFLWATPPCLPEAMHVLSAWGFKYVTIAFTWIKTNPKAGTYFFGIGYYTRSNAELCLLGKRGKPNVASRHVSSLIVAPRRQHSQKPDEVYSRIETLCGDVPRIELFARQRWNGWDAHGNEIDNSIII